MARRTHRLYVGHTEDEFSLESDRVHYLRDVLRLRENDEFLVFDGHSEYEATLKSLDKRHCVIKRGRPTRKATVRPRLHLCHAALKTSLDQVVQVATELAVTDFWMFGAARSNAPRRWRLERLARIAQGAAEQCQRVSTPELHEAQDLVTLLDGLAGSAVFFGDIVPGAQATRFSALEPHRDVAIVIGPEGGWTTTEQSLLRDHDAHAVHLGPQVLRATTAGHTALAALHTARGWPVDAIEHDAANG